MITIEYKEFKDHYDSNPDLDNAEYYELYPDVNKSTIRSWKSRAAKIEEIPDETEAKTHEGFEEIQTEYIKLLITQTGSKVSEFKGVDSKSTLMILKNRKAAQDTENKEKKKTMNSTILGNPPPIGQNKRKYGIDEYIVFDDQKGEIRMQIPMDVLLDPKKNKSLGLIE